MILTRRRNFLNPIGLLLLWTLAVIAAVLAEAMWWAEPAVERGNLAAIEQHLLQRLTDAAAQRKLGCAGLALVQGGRIVAEHGVGIANAETQAPVKTDQTLFIVGSVSKAVTAWGVMKLVEAGKLGLDEPVLRHLKRWRFPGSEAYRDKVTVRHLLSHTAGRDDGFGFSGFAQGKAVQDWMYWETGRITFEGRRQLAQRRLLPAVMAMMLEAIALVWRRH